MYRSCRATLVPVFLLAAAAGTAVAQGRSRSAALAVSAVVVPRCSIDASRPGTSRGTGVAMSMRCSGHAVRTVTALLNGAQRPLLVRSTADQNRLDARWTAPRSRDLVLTIEF